MLAARKMDEIASCFSVNSSLYSAGTITCTKKRIKSDHKTLLTLGDAWAIPCNPSKTLHSACSLSEQDSLYLYSYCSISIRTPSARPVQKRYSEATLASDYSRTMDNMLKKNFVEWLLARREKKSE